MAEVEALLVDLILDRRIPHAHIDQVRGGQQHEGDEEEEEGAHKGGGVVGVVQIEGYLELGGRQDAAAATAAGSSSGGGKSSYEALGKWADVLGSLSASLNSRVASAASSASS